MFAPQPIVKQLSLLTYNTHLFEGSLAEPAAKYYAHKKIVVADAARRTKLVARIRKLQPDIVCLQEVWAKEMQRALAQELYQIYPHVYAVPDKGHHNFLLDEFTNTSGLMVASQYSINNPRFKMYTGLSVRDDKLAKKGALAFSISFPISPTESTIVNIGTTHCPTGIQDAQKAVKTAVKLTFGDGQIDSILAGDFNLHIKTTSEYEELNKTMAQYHARDIVYDCLPDLENSYTDYGGNKLGIALGRQESENKDRIDYVYFAPGSKASRLEPMSAEVFHDWELDNKLPVSDHYPVFVKFHVSAK